jgi:uridine kinase
MPRSGYDKLREFQGLRLGKLVAHAYLGLGISYTTIMKDVSFAHRASKIISEWSAPTGKLVVGLDGHTGTGKTTLLEQLADLNPDILPVHRDDFLFPRQKVQELLANTPDQSTVFELEVCDVAKLREFISTYKTTTSPYHIEAYNPDSGECNIDQTYDFSKKIMVVEGVFMFHPKLTNDLWDKRIYLDGDAEKIKARRIQREKDRWKDEYFPEDHPDSYFRHVIIALKRYEQRYNPKNQADIVLRIEI